MYGTCQKDGCGDRATHEVEFRNQPTDPMKACGDHARMYRQYGHAVRQLV